MSQVAGLYAQYSGKKVSGRSIRPVHPIDVSAIFNAQTIRQAPKPPVTAATAAMADNTPVAQLSGFEDLDHSWAPKGYTTGSTDKTYADLAAAKEEAEARKREREAKAALEAREAEIERRERALANKETDKSRLEAARRKAAEEGAKRKQAAKQPKRPPFDFLKERPQVLVSIANASQAANNLVNACRVSVTPVIGTYGSLGQEC